MDTATVLSLVKARLGISTGVRDAYLTVIINGLIEEIENQQGINLDKDNDNHIMFLVDYTAWRYQSRDSTGGLPKHLMYRLKNLYVESEAIEDV